MLSKIIFIVIMIVTFQVSAKSHQFDISSLSLTRGESKSVNGVCYIPKLTAQQLYIYDDIRKLHFSTTKKMRTLLESQRKAYENVLHDEKLKTSGFADRIAKKYFKTQYHLTKDKTAFFHAVLYKILLKPQREALLKCI